MKHFVSTLALASLSLMSLSDSVSAASLNLVDTASIISTPESYYSDLDAPGPRPVNGTEKELRAWDQKLAVFVLSHEIFYSPGLTGNQQSDGSYMYNGNSPVNRAEATKFFQKFRIDAKGFVADAHDYHEPVDLFTDWAQYTYFEDEWFLPDATILKEEGIISGNPDGSFGASNPLTTAAVAKFLNNTYKFGQVNESQYSSWDAGYAEKMFDMNIFSESTYNRESTVTRFEMAEYIFKANVAQHFDAPYSYYNAMRYLEHIGSQYMTLRTKVSGDLEKRYLYEYVYNPMEDLQITGIYEDATQAGEFVDITYTGTKDLDMSGYFITLVDDEAQGEIVSSGVYQDTSVQVRIPDGYVMSPNSILRIHSTDGRFPLFENGTGQSGSGMIDNYFGMYGILLYGPQGLVDTLFFDVTP